MDIEDCRQSLEGCLHLEAEYQASDVEAIQGLHEEFKEEMKKVVEDSTKIKFFFATEAGEIFDKTKSEVIENRRQVNKQIANVVIRYTLGIIILYLGFIGLSHIKKTVDDQFCNFYNVQGRTQRYETQKPCKR